jgi:hypothetical protein
MSFRAKREILKWYYDEKRRFLPAVEMTDSPRKTFYERINFDAFAKSPKPPFPVIPVKTGIQEIKAFLDSHLRGSDDLDDFLRVHQFWSNSDGAEERENEH